MKISFIIPMYNCEKYIGRCLKSIININYDDLEIIVVNDGSTDNSEKIVKFYSKKYSNITLYNKMNEGLSKARNFGISKAKGDYLFFVDSDDMVISNEVENIIGLCRLDKYNIIAGTYFYYFNEENCNVPAPFIMERNHKSSDLNYLLTLRNYTAEAVKYIVKKTFLIEHNLSFEENLLHEDELYTPKLLLNANDTDLIIYYTPFYLYRKHDHSITTTVNITKAKNVIFICNELYKMKSTINNEIKKNFLRRRANLLFISICSTLCYYKKNEQKELVKQLNTLTPLFKSNISDKKEILAYYLIKVFGYKGFCLIQKSRRRNI